MLIIMLMIMLMILLMIMLMILLMIMLVLMLMIKVMIKLVIMIMLMTVVLLDALVSLVSSWTLCAPGQLVRYLIPSVGLVLGGEIFILGKNLRARQKEFIAQMFFKWAF
jgi:hypothetical protein